MHNTDHVIVHLCHDYCIKAIKHNCVPHAELCFEPLNKLKAIITKTLVIGKLLHLILTYYLFQFSDLRYRVPEARLIDLIQIKFRCNSKPGKSNVS